MKEKSQISVKNLTFFPFFFFFRLEQHWKLELTLNPFKTKKIAPKISKIAKKLEDRLGFDFFNNYR